MFQRRIFMLTGALGALSVILGAFGAHSLKTWAATLADGADRLKWWDTGSDYLFYALPLFVALGIVEGRAPSRLTTAGTVLGVLGVILFSGSLFAMTLTGIRVLGAITPLGGLSLISAWVCLLLAARRMR